MESLERKRGIERRTLSEWAEYNIDDDGGSGGGKRDPLFKAKKKCLLRNEIPTSVERCVAEETLLVSRSIALSSLFIFIFLNALTIDVFMTSVFSFLSSSSSSIAVLSVSLGQKQFNGPYTHTRIYKLLRLLSSRRVCVFTVGRI